MKDTGMTRTIDDLGRVAIPKEIRRTMRIREGDDIEVFIDGENIVLRRCVGSNGERIRSMTDEELAKYACAELSNYSCPPGRTVNGEGCLPPNSDKITMGDCEKCWLAWLKEEMK